MPRPRRKGNNFSNQSHSDHGGHGDSQTSGTARNNNRNRRNTRRNQNHNYRTHSRGRARGERNNPSNNSSSIHSNHGNHGNQHVIPGNRGNRGNGGNGGQGGRNNRGRRPLEPSPGNLTSSSEGVPFLPHYVPVLPQSVRGPLGELYSSGPIPGLAHPCHGQPWASTPPPQQLPNQEDIPQYSGQPSHSASSDADYIPDESDYGTFTEYLAALASSIPEFSELLSIDPAPSPTSPPHPVHYCVDSDGDVDMHNAPCHCAVHQLPQWVMDHISVLERDNVTLRGVVWASTVWDRLWAEPGVRWALATLVRGGIEEAISNQAAEEDGLPDSGDSDAA